ncbi:MAG TPA: hypothetical protein VHE54_15855 [Puia sp.]|nr:hypothetical protein [Puia sp.]
MYKSSIRTTAVLLAVWLLLLGLLSAGGFFADFSALPPRLSFALLAPLAVLLIFLRRQPGRALLQQIAPQWPVYLQSFRIAVEAGIWLLVRRGALPLQMSFEGRNFDITIGVMAFPVGYYCFVRKVWSPAVALGYNIAGLLSLINIVTISVLSMPTPLRVFHNQPDSSLLSRFPYIYLPGLLVPLAYTLHILSIAGFFRMRQPSGIRKGLGA